jgi:NADPH:quinone reductase-like Zn-dependent oxidoreductase
LEHGDALKAAIHERYGTPEVLRLADVPTSEPTGSQVLVDVMATSLNLTDWESLTGSPMSARIGGLRRPAHSIPGSDIAGTVVPAGLNVEKFRVGDAVYGDNLEMRGGFAEYALEAEGWRALEARCENDHHEGALLTLHSAFAELGRQLGVEAS